MDDEQKRFHSATLDLLKKINEVGYSASVFSRMLSEHGGYNSAKMLLSKSNVSEGYKALWELGRLDLTVEALVVQSEWKHLFTEIELTTAKRRLKEFGAPAEIINPEVTPLTPAIVNSWTRRDIDLCIGIYVAMVESVTLGKQVNVSSQVKKLTSDVNGHSEGSVRNLLQNISYELQQLGIRTVSNISPRPNSSKQTKIAVAEFAAIMFQGSEESELKDKESKANLLLDHTRPPMGNINPKRVSSSNCEIFIRDASVKAYVKAQAQGKCESCRNLAPFLGTDGHPYLEVHHIRTLAEGGPDTVSNAVALCPNCHRAFHYSENSSVLIEQIYLNVNRLKA